MKYLTIAFSLFAYAACAQEQPQSPQFTADQANALIHAVQTQRDLAMNAHAQAEARIELLNSELAKLKGKLDEAEKKLKDQEKK